jgi:hypothetical protein
MVALDVRKIRSMQVPNIPQRVVLVTASVTVLALAFYPPFFPQHIRSGRFDVELAAVTLATIGLLLALRGLRKFPIRWRLPNISQGSSGWKRLWVVLSFIYLSVVMGFVWQLYPTNPSEGARSAALAASRGTAVTSDPWAFLGPDPKDLRATAIYNETLREYHEGEKRTFLIKAALWWVCPVAVIYLLGRAWSWVYRGFLSVPEEG